MRFFRSVIRSEAGRTVLAVLVIFLAWTVWSGLQADAKIDDRVPELVDRRGRVDVEIELRFSPERFHILVIQDRGRIRRTIGNVVHARIELAELRRLARRHWIIEIRPAEDPPASSAGPGEPQASAPAGPDSPARPSAAVSAPASRTWT